MAVEPAVEPAVAAQGCEEESTQGHDQRNTHAVGRIDRHEALVKVGAHDQSGFGPTSPLLLTFPTTPPIGVHKHGLAIGV